MYPAANSPVTIAQGYNHVTQEGQETPRRQDLIRLDWMPSPSWRIYGKLLQTWARTSQPYGGGTTGYGTNIPEFGSRGRPARTTAGISMTAAVTLNNTTFLEMTYGRARNAFTNMPAVPRPVPTRRLRACRACRCSIRRRCSSTCRRASTGTGGWARYSPTNRTEYAPFLNENPTQDLAGSLTKTFGPHTAKAGALLQPRPQAAEQPRAGQREHQLPERRVEPARRGLPVRQRGARASTRPTARRRQWVQGNYVYNNVEWYVQDNWRSAIA